MPLAEKRAQYKNKSYTTLDTIPSWTEYFNSNKDRLVAINGMPLYISIMLTFIYYVSNDIDFCFSKKLIRCCRTWKF